MAIRIIPISEPETAPLVPDIVWDGRCGDYRRVGADEPGNPYGLQSRQSLATAVLICLQTDRAVDPSALRDGDEQKGWAGDAFDVDEQKSEGPIGSIAWQLRRSTVDEFDTPRFAEFATRQALQPLIDQGAVARVDFESVTRPEANRFEYTVSLFGRDGRQVFSQRFALLWDQLHGVYRPLA